MRERKRRERPEWKVFGRQNEERAQFGRKEGMGEEGDGRRKRENDGGRGRMNEDEVGLGGRKRRGRMEGEGGRGKMRKR